MAHRLRLEIQKGRYAVCRIGKSASFPEWARGNFISLTRTEDEVSIVCEQQNIPRGIECEKGWACIRVVGHLNFALTGILASLAEPLAQAGISIFAISTFDTDNLLIKEGAIERARQVLSSQGHTVLEKGA